MPALKSTNRRIEVTANDLPLACPRPEDPLWSQHPRVYLDVVKTGAADCPYCGNHFELVGDVPKGHH